MEREADFIDRDCKREGRHLRCGSTYLLMRMGGRRDASQGKQPAEQRGWTHPGGMHEGWTGPHGQRIAASVTMARWGEDFFYVESRFNRFDFPGRAHACFCANF